MNETNKQANRTRDMEIKNKQTVTRGEGWEEAGKEGHGSSQGTGTNDPWTWKTKWKSTV